MTYKQTFDFDRFGNMYRKTANNNPSGQENPLPYTPIEETTTLGTGDIEKATNRFAFATNTTYDEAGNVTTDNKFRTMGFNYDANGRMVKATKANSPDAISTYDASGMRVAEKVNDIWRFLIYDVGGKLVSEYGGSTSNDEGGVKYLLSDWQGSTRTVLSNSGTVNGRSDYTAFGEEIATGTGQRTTTQGFGTTNSTRQKYGLTERDDATGLDHTWFRKHENRAGRWTGPDPYNGSMSLGNPQSFNRFGYVENQPTNFTDPSGLLIGYCFRTCVRVENDDGTWGPYECETHCTLVDIGNGPVWPTVGTTDIAGGGGPDQITPKIPTRESHCRSLSKAIRSHVKQAQRHLNNYGNDFSKWVANDFPYNPLTGQLRDYQNHVYQADKLTNQYNAECDDQEPPPPVPVFARVPSELLNWKPFLNRLWDLLPSAPTKKQVDQWYPSPWGPVPMPGRRIPIPIPF